MEWETVTLPQLVAHAGADPDMVVWVDAAVASSATWLTALGWVATPPLPAPMAVTGFD